LNSVNSGKTIHTHHRCGVSIRPQGGFFTSSKKALATLAGLGAAQRRNGKNNHARPKPKDTKKAKT
ncbi:MAG: hypothetical protein AAF862_17405, partial [Pseudomonadota bacterium]